MPSDFLHNFMDQKWEDLLLLHWPVAQVRVQETLPDDLRVDLFEEQAWLSVVGFRLSGLKIAPFRWIQWPGFWEINLRTYVKDKNGRKGIWFYSLDSSDLFAVIGARILYGLHYNYARTDGGVKDNQIFFHSERKYPHNQANSEFFADLSAGKHSRKTKKTGLDTFLLERYRFWSRRKLSRFSKSAKVKHVPYQSIKVNTARYKGELFKSQGFGEPTEAPVLGHYCKGFGVQATAPSWLFSTAGQANQR